MAERTFPLEILTMQRAVLKTDVVAVNAPGEEGRFAVYAGHEPYVFGLEPGELDVLYPGGNREIFALDGGFLVVEREGVTILARSAERPSEIDEERARRAKERAERRLRERERDLDIARAEMALKRAITRLKVKQHGR